MSKLRTVIRRTDGNQTEVVKAFRDLGCSVTIASMVGKGFPDLVVGINGYNILVEVKDGNKPPSARHLTKPEIAWHSAWLGQSCVVESISDVERIVREFKEY